MTCFVEYEDVKHWKRGQELEFCLQGGKGGEGLDVLFCYTFGTRCYYVKIEVIP